MIRTRTTNMIAVGLIAVPTCLMGLALWLWFVAMNDPLRSPGHAVSYPIAKPGYR